MGLIMFNLAVEGLLHGLQVIVTNHVFHNRVTVALNGFYDVGVVHVWGLKGVVIQGFQRIGTSVGW